MKKTVSILLALLMLLSLCACGASSGSTTEPTTDSATAESYSRSAYSLEAADEDYSYDSNGLAAAGSDITADSGAETDGTGAEVNPDKIIYSAEATVETTDFDSTISALSGLIEDYGGWVESSSVSGANYYSKARGYSSLRSAYYTLRIPSDKFSELMTGLSTLGNVPYTYTYSENVTAQYYDTQARLTAYEAQETRLLELLEQAETVEDVISIESELTELRYEIESLQSTLNNYDRKVNYSTLDLTIEEVAEYTPETEISYGRELWLALTGALKNTGKFFKDLLVFLVSALPAIAIIAALYFLLRPVWRKARAKRAAKKAAKSAKPDADSAGPKE